MKIPATASKQYLFIYISLVIIAIGAFFAFRIYWPHPVTSSHEIIDSCDINSDNFCDLGDLKIIYDSIGACEGEEHYREDFDINSDGCLTDPEDLDALVAIYYRVLDTSKIPTPVMQEYNASCDFDRDLDCDDRDITRFHEIVAERAKVQTIVDTLAAYHDTQEEYPESLDELVPNFLQEIPQVQNMKYEPLKGRREYELCYTSIENGFVCLPK